MRKLEKSFLMYLKKLLESDKTKMQVKSGMFGSQKAKSI